MTSHLGNILSILALYAVHQCHGAAVIKISEYMDSGCQTDQLDSERYVTLDTCLMDSASVWLKYKLMGSNYYKQYYNVTGCTAASLYDEDVVSKDQCNAKPSAAGVNHLPSKYWKWTAATATMFTMSMHTASGCATKSSDSTVPKDVCITDNVFVTDSTIAQATAGVGGTQMHGNIRMARGVKWTCNGAKFQKTTYNNTECTNDASYTEETVEYSTAASTCKTVSGMYVKVASASYCSVATATTGTTAGGTTASGSATTASGTTGNSTTSGNATTAATTATTGNALVNGAVEMSCRWALLLLGALLATMSQ